MPIIDLQRRLTEVGRIRMGDKVATANGSRPNRLDHWRLTGRDAQRLEAAASIYGGEVRPWEGREGEYELYTTTDALAILLMPGQAITQWNELWSGGGAVRRCDGVTEMISGEPCLCGSYGDREEAKDGTTYCKPTTRLAVLLPEVPGIGCWRLETHGYYAAVELAGTASLLEEATKRGSLLPARLRIDQRSQLKGGKTTRFPVPVIDIDVRLPEIIAAANGAADGEIAAPERLALPAAPITISATGAAVANTGGTNVSGALAYTMAPPAAQPARANAAEPIGAPAPPLTAEPLKVEDDDTPIPESPPSANISKAQLKLLWTTIRERGVPEATVRAILQDVTGQGSTRAIPKALFDAVLAGVQGAQVEA